MPIQINELIIKAQVVDDANYTPGGKGTQDQKSKDKESIIKECIEQIMEILKEKKER